VVQSKGVERHGNRSQVPDILSQYGIVCRTDAPL
jgi:hypothetical protein